MRLDVPNFSGVDPESWIFAINEYFSLLNTPADQRWRIVGFNLEGAAAECFRWMTRNGLITTWARFEESVKNHFGPSKYEIRRGVIETVAISCWCRNQPLWAMRSPWRVSQKLGWKTNQSRPLSRWLNLSEHWESKAINALFMGDFTGG
ncbi:hypothetical protein Tco_1268162 [Tanacetum coccineum]